VPIPLGELEVFFAVVDSGSFSAAARRLGLTPSAVSKLVSRLEARLDARLLQRSSRALSLTEAGRALYEEGQGVFAALASAENAVKACSDEVSGTLRVHSMVTFAKYQLAPAIGDFLARHPRLRVEFVLSNDAVDFIEHRIDVSIQGGPLPDSSLVARRLLHSPWIICAAPGYLARYGTPAVPGDLAHHNCLNFTQRTDWNAWPLIENGVEKAVPAQGNVGANLGDMLLELARSGLGLVRLAEFHIRDDLRSGRLVPVLEAFRAPAQEPLYVVYQGRKHLSPRVRAFLGFMEECFSD